MNSPNMQLVGEIIAGEYVRSPRGSAQTFLEMYRLLLGLSALSEMEVFSAAQRIFSLEYAAYKKAVEAGTLPPILHGPYANRFAVTFDPELN